ncbi:hypothetical protein TNCV_5059031 [Trichonephila clavipes]|nr:hypothetical protein TNCV_5059031 [Trichonephila clavipes]
MRRRSFWRSLQGTCVRNGSSSNLNPLNHTHVTTVDDFTAQIVVTSADIANTPNLFESVRQSVVCRCRHGYDLRDCIFEPFL